MLLFVVTPRVFLFNLPTPVELATNGNADHWWPRPTTTDHYWPLLTTIEATDHNRLVVNELCLNFSRLFSSGQYVSVCFTPVDNRPRVILCNIMTLDLIPLPALGVKYSFNTPYLLPYMLPYTTLHCNALPYTTIHCLILPYTALHGLIYYHIYYHTPPYNVLHCFTLLYTTLHGHTLSYTVLHCLTLPYTALHLHTLSCTALHCNTLPYTALHCHTLPYTAIHCLTLRIHCLALSYFHTLTYSRTPAGFLAKCSL